MMNHPTRIQLLATLSIAISGAAHAQQRVKPVAPVGSEGLIDVINGGTDGAPPILPFAEGMRWMGAANGTPISLRWSLVPDGLVLTDSNGVNRGPSTLFATLDNLFGEGVTDPADPRFQFGGRDGTSGAGGNSMGGWLEVFDEAFESWELRSGLAFEQTLRNMPDPMIPDDVPAFNAWDAGSAWFTQGPQTDPNAPLIGDIRFGMAALDGPGGRLIDTQGTDAQVAAAMAGHVIFDSAENWAALDSSVAFQFLFNQIARSVGFSVGLLEACPETGDILMRRDPLVGNNNAGPQFEDVRAVHRLYGDGGELNDTMGNASLIGVSPNDPNNDFVIMSNVPSATSPQTLGPISIDRNGDIDFYSFVVNDPDVIFTFQLIPEGGTAIVNDVARDPANGCDPANDMQINRSALQNLSMTIFDNNGVETQTINSAAAGGTEEFVLNSTLDDMGQWFIRVQGDMNDEVQRYILTARAVLSDIPGLTDEFQLFLNDEARLNIGTWTALGLRTDGGNTPLDFSTQNPPLQRTVIGVIESLQPNLTHTTLSNQTQVIAAWPATGPGDPDRAITDRLGEHATAVAAAAVGQPFFLPRGGTLEDIEFAGVATESILATGAPAIFITSGGTGLIGIEALYFSLFALTDPLIATASLGLPAPATVINASFGGVTSDFPGVTGDGDLATAFDALVWMRDVTVVLPAGDSGGIDRTATCEFDGDPMQPGGTFVGARTVNNPATCFNAIVVGGVATQFGTQDDTVMGDDNMDNFQDDILRIPTFSAKGPIDSFDFQNQMVVMETRPGVHLLAPASGAVSETPFQNACPYPGKRLRESLAVPGFDPDLPALGQEQDFTALVGTSFSAPIVAGAVALMEDFTTLMGDVPYSPLIYKACLINSAQKMEGWSNNGDPGMPQDARDGRMEMGTTGTQLDLWDPESDQPLDYAQGGGWLDMQVLFAQFAGANPGDITRDLPQTPPRRSVVTRVFVPPIPNPFPAVGPIIGELEQTDPDFPTLAERGQSPVEIRSRLASARTSANEEEYMRPLADNGDAPLGGGNPGVVPMRVERPVTGSLQNTTLPFIPGQPGLPRAGQVPLGFDPLLVEQTGWDLAQVGVRTVPNEGRVGFVDYVITDVEPGMVITATLVWNRRVEVNNPNFNNLSNPGVGQVTALELENLDLTLFISNEFGDAAGMVAQSDSTFSNVEHVTYQSPAGGDPNGDNYVLRVEWIETEYDLFRNGVEGDTQYCLAWRTSQLGGTIFNPIIAPSVAGGQPEFNFSNLVNLVLGFGSTVYIDQNYTFEADLNTDGRIDFADLTRMLDNM